MNIALALSKMGSRVAMIDGDIYGPNVPIMLGISTQLATDGQKIVPAEQYGLQLVALGFLTNDDSPVIWRGPMLHGAIQQFFRDVSWDRPRLSDHRHAAGHGRRRAEPQPDGPGRRKRGGHHSAAVWLARPNETSGSDNQQAHRADAGLIENMSYFVCPPAGRERHLRKGAGESLAMNWLCRFSGDSAL